MGIPREITGGEAAEDFHEAVRREVFARAEKIYQGAIEWEAAEAESEGGYYAQHGLHFITRERQFGVTCDVVELGVSEQQSPGARTERVRLFRPVLDPTLTSDAFRSVLLWVELGFASEVFDEETGQIEKTKRGMFVEFRHDATEIVDPMSRPSARILEFPVPMPIKTGGLDVFVDGLLEKNGDNYQRHLGPPLPTEPLLAA
jgi:hypothetical protein